MWALNRENTHELEPLYEASARLLVIHVIHLATSQLLCSAQVPPSTHDSDTPNLKRIPQQEIPRLFSSETLVSSNVTNARDCELIAGYAWALPWLAKNHA